MKYFFLTLLSATIIIFSVCVENGQTIIAAPSEKNQSKSDYEKWIAPYQQSSTANGYAPQEAPPKLIISIIVEADPAMPNKNNPLFIDNGKSFSGWQISADGVGRWFSYNPFGTKGNCCSQIEKEQMKRIDQLLAELPDDHSQLPPIGRRLVFQISHGGIGNGFVARVYDLANAPEKILELLRLAKTGFRSNVLFFNPENQWKASDYTNDGGLAITADASQIISSGLNGPIKIWDVASHNLIREAAVPPNVPFAGLVLSPDNSLAAIAGWGVIGLINLRTWQPIRRIAEPFIDRKRHQLSNPQFIKNGKFLVVESDEPGLHIYNTENWERVAGLPEIPIEAISYFPSPSGRVAVYQSKDGQVFLRNTKSGRNSAAIEAAQVKYVAFSSDEASAAIVTFHPAIGNERFRYRIKIWNTRTGHFIRELLPFEQNFCESIEGLKWSPDDKYILAANKADIFFTSRGISIWNVETGRHRGEMQGCPTNMLGFGFLSNKSKIVAGCGDGIIRIWDWTKALVGIREFEKQLDNR